MYHLFNLIIQSLKTILPYSILSGDKFFLFTIRTFVRIIDNEASIWRRVYGESSIGGKKQKNKSF